MTNLISGNTGDSPFPLSLSEGEGADPAFMAGKAGEGVKRKIGFARFLRKSMTDAEKKMWYLLRDRRFSGHKFRRQYPVGKYVADFVCTKQKLIIELDGGQHALQPGYDKARDEYLKGQGYRVLRFWNNDVFENMEGVMQTIALTLTPTLSLNEGEGEVFL